MTPLVSKCNASSLAISYYAWVMLAQREQVCLSRWMPIRRLSAVLMRAPRTNFCRSIPNQGPTRLRTNSGMSIYHSLQTSLEKRLSSGFSAGLHYTYSTFIDTMSEIFNVSSGEIAVAQDSYNRRADRARSSFDRPHRVAGNFVYELPYFRDQKGMSGLVLGGWQLNSQFSLQSGSPFTPLNGSDPAIALASISVAGRQCDQAEPEYDTRSFVDEC